MGFSAIGLNTRSAKSVKSAYSMIKSKSGDVGGFDTINFPTLVASRPEVLSLHNYHQNQQYF
jgi:hypothetical protein